MRGLVNLSRCYVAPLMECAFDIAMDVKEERRKTNSESFSIITQHFHTCLMNPTKVSLSYGITESYKKHVFI